MTKKKKNQVKEKNELSRHINSTANTYGPDERSFMEQNQQSIRSGNKNGFTNLPDPVTDDIVSNNISQSEFDYTYNGGKDSFDEDEDER